LTCTADDKVLGPKHQEEEASQQQLAAPPAPSPIVPSPASLSRLIDSRPAESALSLPSRPFASLETDPPSLECHDPEWCDVCERKCDWPFRRLESGRIEAKVPMPRGYLPRSDSVRRLNEEDLPIPVPQSPMPWPAFQSVAEVLRQTWSSINDASDSLLKLGPKVEKAEQLLNSLFPSAASWKGDPARIHYAFEFIKSFRKLDIRGAWEGMGQVWANFSSKMRGLSSSAETLLLSRFHVSNWIL
jgi:hypothetical protein